MQKIRTIYTLLLCISLLSGCNYSESNSESNNNWNNMITTSDVSDACEPNGQTAPTPNTLEQTCSSVSSISSNEIQTTQPVSSSSSSKSTNQPDLSDGTWLPFSQIVSTSSSVSSATKPISSTSSSKSSSSSSSTSSKPISSSSSSSSVTQTSVTTPPISSSSSKSSSGSSKSSLSSPKPVSSSTTAHTHSSTTQTSSASSSTQLIPIEEKGCTSGEHDLIICNGKQPTCYSLGATPYIICATCNEIFTQKSNLDCVHTLIPVNITSPNSDGEKVVTYRCASDCGMLLRKSYTDALNETNVRNTILSARSLYFEGMPFDNSKYYFSPKLFPGVNYTAYGCAAFAVELSDKAFDDLPARHHFNFNKIRVGDIVRIDSNKHSAIVIDVNGNEITIAEANFNNSVHWGRKLNINDPTVGWSYVLTRYPE